jgi:hypothetical protein
MKSVCAAAVLAVALVGTGASARELKGIQFPDTTSVDGKDLKLKGLGVRNKWFVDVYVAGLYLADPDKDPLADSARQVKLVMLRDVGASSVGDAVREGFEKNSGPEMPKLKERLDRMIKALTDLKKHETLVLTYVPEKGTTVSGRGKELVAIEGKDFGDALFNVWLGKAPVDDGLKKGLLGG